MGDIDLDATGVVAEEEDDEDELSCTTRRARLVGR